VATGPERLQKLLAGVGVGSRREIETWIRAGRVTIDGKAASLGQRVTGQEAIAIDGRPVTELRRPRAGERTLVYHKPAGQMCTRRDPEGRPTVFENLPPLQGRRWISVGRLDFTTSGLLLVTTDGALAHGLMHPSRQLAREYMVRILGEVPAAVLEQLRAGITLEDGPARFDVLVPAGEGASNRWFRVEVREGRNRLVRRLWEAAGLQVSRLMRVRYGPVELPRALRAGRWQAVEGEALAALYAAAGVTPADAEPARPAARAGRPRQAGVPPRGRSRSGSRSRSR
jgi:23S rRNA pseudouridine2605 synthase